MKHSDFKIGTEFTTAAGSMRWRCTDVGTRVIVAIHITDLTQEWLSGPPYAILESVFDENDIEGCEEEK
jgi:hypothetical protein